MEILRDSLMCPRACSNRRLHPWKVCPLVGVAHTACWTLVTWRNTPAPASRTLTRSFVSSLEGPGPNCNSCVETKSWKPLKLSFNLAREKTNLDAFVLARRRRTRAILLGCCSILGSHAAQESFLWPLREANTSARDNAASPQGLQELCPALAISKIHCSHRKRNEGNKKLCHLMGENAKALPVIARSSRLYTQWSPIKGFLVGIA